MKFYSQRSIGIATFIGGPLAAGILIRENYLTLNEPKNGNKALLIGIVSTILLLVAIFSFPQVINKIPNQIIPIVYTAIIYSIVEQIHGEILKEHKTNEKEFHSIWKAIGLGIISLITFLIIIFGYDHFSGNTALYSKYDIELTKFTNNETETLKFYENYYTTPTKQSVKEIDENIIPKWEENIRIIEKTNSFEELSDELLEQNQILIEYSNLRIEAFKKLKKALKENTNKYDRELDSLHNKIDETLKKIN